MIILRNSNFLRSNLCVIFNFNRDSKECASHTRNSSIFLTKDHVTILVYKFLQIANDDGRNVTPFRLTKDSQTIFRQFSTENTLLNMKSVTIFDRIEDSKFLLPKKDRKGEEERGQAVMQLHRVAAGARLPAPRVCNLICNRNQVGANRRIAAE